MKSCPIPGDICFFTSNSRDLNSRDALEKMKDQLRHRFRHGLLKRAVLNLSFAEESQYQLSFLTSNYSTKRTLSSRAICSLTLFFENPNKIAFWHCILSQGTTIQVSNSLDTSANFSAASVSESHLTTVWETTENQKERRNTSTSIR